MRPLRDNGLPMTRHVVLRPSGRTFEVRSDETVLDAARRQGVSLPFACRNGSCAACTGRVLAGEIDYPAGEPVGLTDNAKCRSEALLCSATARSDLEIDVLEALGPTGAPVKTLPARVQDLRRLSHDVMAVTLKLPPVERLDYRPGQYIDILLEGVRRRSFSMANPPREDGLLELHVRYVPDGRFTRYVFEAMRPGEILRIQGPLGRFTLDPERPDPALLVAGGTGFAPLRAMLMDAFARGSRRRFFLYWGARQPEDLYEYERVDRWCRRHGDRFGFIPVLSEAGPADGWRGRTGFVHEAVLADRPDLSGVDVYASGPPPMIEAIRRDFPRAGLGMDRFRYDAFDYAPDTLNRIADGFNF